MAGVEMPRVLEGRVHPRASHFEELRREREERYAGRESGSKRRAVQTIVHNEPVFLPIWLRYYSRFFGADDIYVLDNETDDGSTDGEGFVRTPVSHGSVDHVWMADTLADHQRELFDSYDVVVTTDVDELMVPDPEWGTLDTYLDRIDEEFVTCRGYELLHMRDREPPLRLSEPVLDQRRFWFANQGYDKPAVSTEPARWSPGLHWREDGRRNVDPDLFLVHLHRMDFDLCRERHMTRSRRAWNDLDSERGWAVLNQLVEEGSFERWFYEDSAFERMGIKMVVEPIPESWRSLF